MIGFLVLSLVLTLVVSLHIDTDFFWHIKAGEYMSKHGVLTKDVFSWYMYGKSWMSHEWLFEIIIYNMSKLLGNSFYFIFTFLCIGCLALILFHYNKKNYLKNIPFTLLWIVCSLILVFFVQIRPHLVSYIFLGKEKTRGSILGSLVFPICVKLTSDIGTYIDIDNSQLLLSAVFGGVLYGFGAGMIFKAGYTGGGTDILSQLINKYLKLSIGKSILCTDGTIVVLSSFIFGTNKLLYAIITLYIISLISDRVILGISDSKAFYIVTDEEQAIKEYILKYLNHTPCFVFLC